jgi:uncharacterized protein (DUF1499 family)
MFKLRGKRPGNLGVNNGKLAPCPNKPNCVSSQADPSDKYHSIAPLKFTRDAKSAMQRLAKVVQAQPRTEIVQQTDTYLYAEFSTALMGYVDDVEFMALPEQKLIHVRSASRLGHSDLGVNRKRVEALRAEFEKNS